MSSSGSGSGVDCGVGSIVWVRRRNGSWWPGKILGPDDVSTSHLTSPRSGTPVKLLGREDASIDWYNLEKSKRVKAFRCGEFDDCIERAEASLGLPPKKREKYARREDAILHALQLERQLRKQGTSDHINNKSSGTVKKESGPLSKKLGNDDGKIVISKPSKARGSCQPSRENDLETVPRTKGLRDFGLRIAPSKRKFSSIDSKDTCELNNNSQALPDDVSIRNARHTNGMEQIGVAFPSKRSKCVSLPTDPTNIVEDGKKIPSSLVEMAEEDNHPHLGSAAEINPSKVVEKSESDNSDTESDSTETEPDIDGRMFSHSDVSLPLETDLNSLRRSGAPAMDEILSSEDYDGSPFSGEMTNIYSNDHYSAGETVSKWQLKGKRNIRSLTRRPVDTTRGRGSQNTFTCFSRKFPEQSSGYYRKEDFIDDDDDASDFYPEDNRMERAGVDNREYMFTPRCVSKYTNRLGCDSINWDSVWEDQTSLKGHWEDRWEQSNPVYVSHHYYGDRMRPILIDVDLKVQGAGYQRGSVPLISLTSKVSGQPVVGHPIQVEVLEDGSTENLFSNNAGSDYEMTDYEGIATLPPAWKTARRTAHSRVPRPHLSSNLDGNEYAEVIFPSDQEMGEEPFKKSSPMRKSQTNLLHPLNSRRGPGKSPKKASISPGQRTRTLSSIAADQRFSNKHMHGFSSNRQMDGINKTQSPGPRSVALIPCKLVFSRMLEKINRPPSKS